MKLSIYILSNFFARVWIAGIGIILVPQYIKFLGIESYGLVGFYGTLIGSMSILDLGLSTTLNRELTKARVNNQDPKQVRDLVFTLEAIYFLTGLTIAISIVLLAPVIATHWIKAEHLSVTEVSHAVMLMGLIIAFQWPISLYNGGLIGMDKQLVDNFIMVVMTTIRSAGVILLLWLVSPTIKTFFIWQAITSCIYVFAMRTGLWYYLPKSITTPHFSKQQLKHIWRFAAGMTGISLTAFCLTQIDKIILSKILTLSQFAYYILAFTVASGIGMFIAPINIAYFPRLTAMVTANDNEGLKSTYHKACRLVATVIFPVGLVLVFFTNDILLIWTKNPITVKNISVMVKILVTGSVFNGLMVVPYLLMIAKGNTKFTFYLNLISAIVLVPLLLVLVHFYGSVGGALVWLIINVSYILFSIPIVHQKFLPGELKRWYLHDTVIPLIMPLIVLLLFKLLFHTFQNFVVNIFTITIISSVVLGINMMTIPDSRIWVKDKLIKK